MSYIRYNYDNKKKYPYEGVDDMNIKKTGKIAVLIAASAALVATLINDKNQKQQEYEKEDK